MSFTGVIQLLFPLVLLVSAIIRQTLFSLVYFLFLLIYCLYHPIKRQIGLRTWFIRRVYFHVVFGFATLSLISQIVFQLIEATISPSSKSQEIFDIFGFISYSSFAVGLQYIGPDILVLIAALASIIYINSKPTHRSRMPRRVLTPLIMKALRWCGITALLLAATTWPSFLTLPYYLLFISFAIQFFYVRYTRTIGQVNHYWDLNHLLDSQQKDEDGYSDVLELGDQPEGSPQHRELEPPDPTNMLSTTQDHVAVAPSSAPATSSSQPVSWDNHKINVDDRHSQPTPDIQRQQTLSSWINIDTSEVHPSDEVSLIFRSSPYHLNRRTRIILRLLSIYLCIHTIALYIVNVLPTNVSSSIPRYLGLIVLDAAHPLWMQFVIILQYASLLALLLFTTKVLSIHQEIRAILDLISFFQFQQIQHRANLDAQINSSTSSPPQIPHPEHSTMLLRIGGHRLQLTQRNYERVIAESLPWKMYRVTWSHPLMYYRRKYEEEQWNMKQKKRGKNQSVTYDRSYHPTAMLNTTTAHQQTLIGETASTIAPPPTANGRRNSSEFIHYFSSPSIHFSKVGDAQTQKSLDGVLPPRITFDDLYNAYNSTSSRFAIASVNEVKSHEPHSDGGGVSSDPPQFMPYDSVDPTGESPTPFTIGDDSFTLHGEPSPNSNTFHPRAGPQQQTIKRTLLHAWDSVRIEFLVLTLYLARILCHAILLTSSLFRPNLLAIGFLLLFVVSSLLPSPYFKRLTPWIIGYSILYTSMLFITSVDSLLPFSFSSADPEQLIPRDASATWQSIGLVPSRSPFLSVINTLLPALLNSLVFIWCCLSQSDVIALTTRHEKKLQDIKRDKMLRILQFIKALVLYVCDKIALGVLFLVSLYIVNIIHAIFLLFFVIFMSMRRIAKRCWPFLVVYSGITLLALYSYGIVYPMIHTGDGVGQPSVFAPFITTMLGISPLTSSLMQSKVDQVLGFFLFDSPSDWWRLLFIYYTCFIICAFQWTIYQNHVNDKVGHMFSHASPAWKMIVDTITIVIVYLGVLLCSLLYQPSIFKLVPALIVIISLLLHSFRRQSHDRVIGAVWFVGVCAFAVILLALYIYQFDGVQQWLNETYHSDFISLSDIGFEVADQNRFRFGLVVSISGPVFSFVLGVIFFRVVVNSSSSARLDSSTQTDSLSSSETIHEPLLLSPPLSPTGMPVQDRPIQTAPRHDLQKMKRMDVKEYYDLLYRLELIPVSSADLEYFEYHNADELSEAEKQEEREWVRQNEQIQALLFAVRHRQGSVADLVRQQRIHALIKAKAELQSQAYLGQNYSSLEQDAQSGEPITTDIAPSDRRNHSDLHDFIHLSNDPVDLLRGADSPVTNLDISSQRRGSNQSTDRASSHRSPLPPPPPFPADFDDTPPTNTSHQSHNTSQMSTHQIPPSPLSASEADQIRRLLPSKRSLAFWFLILFPKYIYDFFTRVGYVGHRYLGPLLSLFTWLFVTEFQRPRLLQFALLVLLLALLATRRVQYAWVVVSTYTTLLFLVRYLYQIGSYDRSQFTDFFTFLGIDHWETEDLHNSAISNLWGEIFLLVLATLYRMSLLYWVPPEVTPDEQRRYEQRCKMRDLRLYEERQRVLQKRMARMKLERLQEQIATETLLAQNNDMVYHGSLFDDTVERRMNELLELQQQQYAQHYHTSVSTLSNRTTPSNGNTISDPPGSPRNGSSLRLLTTPSVHTLHQGPRTMAHGTTTLLSLASEPSGHHHHGDANQSHDAVYASRRITTTMQAHTHLSAHGLSQADSSSDDEHELDSIAQPWTANGSHGPGSAESTHSKDVNDQDTQDLDLIHSSAHFSAHHPTNYKTRLIHLPWFSIIYGSIADIIQRVFLYCLYFYQSFGIQLVFFILLLSAVYRANVMSIIDLTLFFGTYVMIGRKTVALYLWTPLIALLVIRLLWQYWFLMGTPPWWSYPFKDLTADQMRWALLGEFSISELHFEFFALLLACSQRKYWYSLLGATADAFKSTHSSADAASSESQRSTACCSRYTENDVPRLQNDDTALPRSRSVLTPIMASAFPPQHKFNLTSLKNDEVQQLFNRISHHRAAQIHHCHVQYARKLHSLDQLTKKLGVEPYIVSLPSIYTVNHHYSTLFRTKGADHQNGSGADDAHLLRMSVYHSDHFPSIANEIYQNETWQTVSGGGHAQLASPAADHPHEVNGRDLYSQQLAFLENHPGYDDLLIDLGFNLDVLLAGEEPNRISYPLMNAYMEFLRDTNLSIYYNGTHNPNPTQKLNGCLQLMTILTGPGSYFPYGYIFDYTYTTIPASQSTVQDEPNTISSSPYEHTYNYLLNNLPYLERLLKLYATNTLTMSYHDSELTTVDPHEDDASRLELKLPNIHSDLREGYRLIWTTYYHIEANISCSSYYRQQQKTFMYPWQLHLPPSHSQYSQGLDMIMNQEAHPSSPLQSSSLSAYNMKLLQRYQSLDAGHSLYSYYAVLRPLPEMKIVTGLDYLSVFDPIIQQRVQQQSQDPLDDGKLLLADSSSSTIPTVISMEPTLQPTASHLGSINVSPSDHLPVEDVPAVATLNQGQATNTWLNVEVDQSLRYTVNLSELDLAMIRSPYNRSTHRDASHEQQGQEVDQPSVPDNSEATASVIGVAPLTLSMVNHLAPHTRNFTSQSSFDQSSAKSPSDSRTGHIRFWDNAPLNDSIHHAKHTDVDDFQPDHNTSQRDHSTTTDTMVKPSDSSQFSVATALAGLWDVESEARKVIQSVWPQIKFIGMILSDKVFALIIFILLVQHVNLIRLGYIVLVLSIILDYSLYVGNATATRQLWSRLQRYNVCILILTVIYQIPMLDDFLSQSFFVSLSSADPSLSPRVPWSDIIGIHRYRAPLMSFSIGNEMVHLIVVFFLIEVQRAIFMSDSYYTVIQYWCFQHAQSELKGRVRAQQRKDNRHRAIFLSQQQTRAKDREFIEILSSVDAIEHELSLNEDHQDAAPTSPLPHNDSSRHSDLRSDDAQSINSGSSQLDMQMQPTNHPVSVASLHIHDNSDQHGSASSTIVSGPVTPQIQSGPSAPPPHQTKSNHDSISYNFFADEVLWADPQPENWTQHIKNEQQQKQHVQSTVYDTEQQLVELEKDIQMFYLEMKIREEEIHKMNTEALLLTSQQRKQLVEENRLQEQLIARIERRKRQQKALQRKVQFKRSMLNVIHRSKLFLLRHIDLVMLHTYGEYYGNIIEVPLEAECTRVHQSQGGVNTINTAYGRLHPSSTNTSTQSDSSYPSSSTAKTVWDQKDDQSYEHLAEHFSFFHLLYLLFATYSQVMVTFVFIINAMINPSFLTLLSLCSLLLIGIIQSPRANQSYIVFLFAYISLLILLQYTFQIDIFCVASNHRSYSIHPDPACLVSPSHIRLSGIVELSSNVNISDALWHFDHLFGLYKTDIQTTIVHLTWHLLALLLLAWHRVVLLTNGVWFKDEEQLGDSIITKAMINTQRYHQLKVDLFKKKRYIKEYTQKVRKGVDPTMITADLSNPRCSFYFFYTYIIPFELKRIYFEIVPQQQRILLPSPAPSNTPSSPGDLETDPLLNQESQQSTAPQQSVSNHDSSQTAVAPRRQKHRWGATIHDIKRGADVYAASFFVELFSSIWIVLAYSSMATTTIQGVSSALSSNFIQGEMVITLFFQIVFIVLDRVSYLKRSLLFKLILHYIGITFWGYHIFFSWPRGAMRGFTDNVSLQMFFLIKAIYYCLSAYQIQQGYTVDDIYHGTMEQQQTLTKDVSLLRYIAYRIYRALPFVYELRVILDWYCSTTALDLWDTFKLEDIFATLYIAKRLIAVRNDKPRGKPVSFFERFGTGLLLFIGLILVLFIPLLLFSSANPGSSANNVIAVELSVRIVSPAGSYQLSEVSSLLSSRAGTATEYNEMRERSMVDSNDKQSSIQVLQLNPDSDSYWTISSGALRALQEQLRNQNRELYLTTALTFLRNDPPERLSLTETTSVPLDNDVKQAFLTAIEEATSSTTPPTPTPVHIPFAIPPYLRLPATSDPIVLVDATQYLGITMVLKQPQLELASRSYSSPASHGDGNAICVSNPSGMEDEDLFYNALTCLEDDERKYGGIYWSVSQVIPEPNQWENMISRLSDDKVIPITLYTVSNPIWNVAFLAGFTYSIVAIYTIVVLTIGNFVRQMFGETTHLLIIKELCDVDRLMQFCQGIYIARSHGLLLQEEELFRKLVRIFRSPEKLVQITARNDAKLKAAIQQQQQQQQQQQKQQQQTS